MSGLASFGPRYRAAVFGASGAIGAALTSILESDANCAAVYAGARNLVQHTQKRRPFTFDLTNEASSAEAAAMMGDDGAPIDLAVVATGVLHRGALQPEKMMRALDAASLAEAYAINAIGPALVAKHMFELMPRDRKCVFAALSARVGSIEDNALGGWHGYRASKAALNQLIRTAAIELARKNKHAICVTLHPGTVDTPLSQPFQKSVPPEKLFAPRLSAARLLSVIDTLTPAQTGRFFAWDGSLIPF